MDGIKILKEYCDKMLNEASWKGSESDSPLLADNVDTEKHGPVMEKDGHIVSNAAHQQNFLRFLCGMSALTGEAVYEERALAIMKYMFDHSTKSGLLRWGGHRYLDLVTLEDRGAEEYVHELKDDYPYYELMFREDPDKAELYIKAFWNSHVYNFDEFEMGRHGREKEGGVDGIWNRHFGDPPAMLQRKGLSFHNTGNDLMYAAGKLLEMKEDEGALLWAGHLHDMYFKSRHPKTHLGAYQFSQALKQKETEDDTITLSMYGDRAKRQLGPEFGEAALEGWVLLPGHEETIYAMNPQIVADCYYHGSDTENRIVRDTVDNMKFFYEYAYDESRAMLRPLLADGTDLSGYALRRDGYYGPKGHTFEGHALAGDYLLAYVEMAMLTGDEELWKITQIWEKALGITDSDGRLNKNCKCGDPGALLAAVKLCEHGEREYLALAEKIADNIYTACYTDGYFKKKDSKFSRLDTIEPLALLKLEALREGKPYAVPDTIYRRRSSCQ